MSKSIILVLAEVDTLLGWKRLQIPRWSVIMIYGNGIDTQLNYRNTIALELSFSNEYQIYI